MLRFLFFVVLDTNKQNVLGFWLFIVTSCLFIVSCAWCTSVHAGLSWGHVTTRLPCGWGAHMPALGVRRGRKHRDMHAQCVTIRAWIFGHCEASDDG